MPALRKILPMGLAGVALVLASCGGEPAGEPPARPVLVARPESAPGVARSFPGEVRAREESPLAFRVGGELVRREVDVGDRVSRGQLLAVLDPGDFEAQARAAEARLSAAEAELSRAAAERARYSALVGDRLVSRSAYEAQEAAWRAAEGQARAARAQVEVARNQAGYAALRAPADGVIAGRHAEAGQVVAAGPAVFTLAADGGREVAIALPEGEVGAHAVGDVVEVELWTSPGERLRGRFREISPAADPAARTYAARVALDGDAADRVAIGQRATVHAAPGDVPLTVPLSAVQQAGDGRPAVWVFADGRVRAVPVRTGARGAERGPVTPVISADDWAVVAGGHLLREGQEARAVDRRNRPVAPGAPDPRP